MQIPDAGLASPQVDSRVVWQQRLAEVEDDMETKLLRAQQAELPFTLQVPDKVRGVVRVSIAVQGACHGVCPAWVVLKR